jgi:TolA-binding protein
MKNGEGVALTVELERRLRQSTDRLRDMRETLEELSQAADALHHLFGLQQMQEQLQQTPTLHRLGEKPAMTRAQKEQSETTPAPAKASRPAPATPAAESKEEEDVPEWRKVFPKLSAHVPGRGK